MRNEQAEAVTRLVRDHEALEHQIEAEARATAHGIIQSYLGPDHKVLNMQDLDTLSGDKAVPYIVNFQMVDTDKDGKISAAEFKTGCGKGWVQSADASTTKEMSPPAKL
jgi:hypothetical protein